MHQRTAELLHHLDSNRAGLRAAWDATPSALRETQPAAGRWSATQVLEHLAAVEAQVAALLRRGLRTAQANGPLPPDADQSPVLPTLDATRLLDRERRFAAPAAALPGKGLGAADAWRALDASRDALRDVLLAADGLDTRAVRAQHPFLGELDFHQWLAFVGYHEARHAAQIKATTTEIARG